MKNILFYALLFCTLCGFSQETHAQTNMTAKAVELMTQGKFKDAIAALDKAAEKGKDLHAVYKLRAALKRMTGDWTGALNDYSLAIEQKADDGELYEQRAMMRLYTRQSPDAVLADLDAAISYGRKHEKVYATRGMIRSQLRDFDGAISDYETAIGLRPDYAGAYLGLSGAYLLNRNEEKAVEVLEKFIALYEKPDGSTETVKGEVVATSGALQTPNISGDKNVIRSEGSVIIKGIEAKKMPGSTDSTEDMNARTDKLEQLKNTAAVYSALGSAYQKRKDYEKALMMVEKALSIDPNDFAALEVRGKIRTDLGDYRGAISDFDAALKIMPNMPPAYLERGIAKLLSGNETEAQKDFDKYLQVFPRGKPFVERRVAEARQKLQQ